MSAHLRERVEAAGLPPAGPDLFVALDIDGTVLRHDNTLSPRVGRAIRAHVEAGTRISLATGRGLYGMREALGLAGLGEGIAVCSNGAITVDLVPNEVLDVRTFDPTREIEALHEVLPQALYAVESLEEPRRLTREFPAGELTGPYLVVPIGELAVPHATRVTVRAPGMEPRELLDAVHAAGLRGVEYAVGWTAWVDISPEGVSKAVALEGVRERCGVDPGGTVAVGDGGNDVQMLGWASFGVAMGGSAREVVAAADAQTGSVEEDGLASVLELLLR